MNYDRAFVSVIIWFIVCVIMMYRHPIESFSYHAKIVLLIVDVLFVPFIYEISKLFLYDNEIRDIIEIFYK
jgi:hypothetical protein